MKTVIYVRPDYMWTRFDWSWLNNLKSAYYLTHIQACGVQPLIGPLLAWARYNQITFDFCSCIDEIDFLTKLNQLAKADTFLYFPDSTPPNILTIRGAPLSYLSRDRQLMALRYSDQPYSFALDN